VQRVNRILSNEKYLEYVNKIKELEKNREFCRHDMQHFIDTARIMYILSLERGFNFDKEIIYACGLIHDIGRWQQYEKGIPHEIASVNLAEGILKECGFEEQEIIEILKAIGNHRAKDNIENSLSQLMYQSDKLSRKCFECKARKECNWSDEKKNLDIKY
jgi:HD superfamily phosphodiesterase